MDKTLYHHRIFCLHGVTGELTADAVSADTSFTVEQAVLDDVVIDVGSQIVLTDGVNTSSTLTITAINMELNVITTNLAAGFDFAAATPTSIVRTPHWAYKWNELEEELTLCPDHPAHPTQPGSASTIDTRAPSVVNAKIIQSTANLTHPAVHGETLEVAAGQTGSVDMVWPFLITVQSIEGAYDAANPNDRMDFLAGPDTPVGVLTQAAPIGATVLNVSQTVVDNTRPSLLVKLIEGGTVNDLGRIISVDQIALTITTTVATTDAFTAGVTAVLIAMAGTLDMPIPHSKSLVGAGGFHLEGTDVYPGMALRVVYRNAGPDPSRMVAYIKYLT